MHSLFHYQCFRNYLRDYYLKRKQNDPKFSYRVFSRIAGYKAPNYIKLVMDGERNLSDLAIRRIFNHLKFNKSERDYFFLLVKYQKEDNQFEKQKLLDKIRFCQDFYTIKNLDNQYHEFMSNWYFPAIREMTLLNHFREDPEWIVRQLNHKISIEQAQHALEVMQILGLLKKDANNRLKPSERNLTTDLDRLHISVCQTHEQLITKAKESLNETHSQCRDISSLTLALNKTTFKKAKKLINRFIRELNILMSETKDVDVVYQFNTQLFNLTKIPWNAKEENGESKESA